MWFLQNLEKNTFREVYHIWYLWPVNGVQSDGAGLIAVLLEARALQRGGPGPIVVHCSPGTGRTGTLIALDLGIRQYEITRTVDVPRVVYTIRRDRAGAVKTKEQYAFIYKVIGFLKLPCLPSTLLFQVICFIVSIGWYTSRKSGYCDSLCFSSVERSWSWFSSLRLVQRFSCPVFIIFIYEIS